MFNDNKKFERMTKVIYAIMLIVAVVVVMVVVAIVVQASGLELKRDKIDVVDMKVQNASVSPQNELETKIDIIRDTIKASEIEVKEDIVEVPEVVEEEPVEEVIEPDPEEVELLAKVIYQEAGADSCCDECRRMVADVVLNRVEDERFPDTIYDVLMQERQYGRYHWTGVVWPAQALYESEAHAVERARRIAEEVLRGEHSKLYGQGYIWEAEFYQGSDVVSCECGGSWIYFGR